MKINQFENLIVYRPELYENKNLVDGNYIDNLVVAEKQKEDYLKLTKVLKFNPSISIEVIINLHNNVCMF